MADFSAVTLLCFHRGACFPALFMDETCPDLDLVFHIITVKKVLFCCVALFIESVWMLGPFLMFIYVSVSHKNNTNLRIYFYVFSMVPYYSMYDCNAFLLSVFVLMFFSLQGLLFLWYEVRHFWSRFHKFSSRNATICSIRRELYVLCFFLSPHRRWKLSRSISTKIGLFFQFLFCERINQIFK